MPAKGGKPLSSLYAHEHLDRLTEKIAFVHAGLGHCQCRPVELVVDAYSSPHDRLFRIISDAL
jgi:hypothetical protein